MWGTALLLLLVMTPRADAAVLAPDMPRFQFEREAQQHCPADIIVWVVESRKIYNSSEERWYGRTSNGAYACQQDAMKAGYRANLAAQ